MSVIPFPARDAAPESEAIEDEAPTRSPAEASAHIAMLERTLIMTGRENAAHRALADRAARAFADLERASDEGCAGE
ncbi:MAG: hypothetical protein AAFN17_10275 [Pseudomonadota bacterium]